MPRQARTGRAKRRPRVTGGSVNWSKKYNPRVPGVPNDTRKPVDDAAVLDSKTRRHAKGGS